MTRFRTGDPLSAKIVCGPCGTMIALAVSRYLGMTHLGAPVALHIEPPPTDLGWYCRKCRKPRVLPQDAESKILTAWARQIQQEHVERTAVLRFLAF